jgi:hypothetical protein
MITARLPSNLGDLIQKEKDEDGNLKTNEFLQALSLPEIKSAMLVLILNEARYYKQCKLKNNPYSVDIGMAKISAWVDIIDLEAFIEDKQSPQPAPQYQDEIPEK